MTVYLYNALKNNKIVVTGRVEAMNMTEARQKIKEMNLIPTSIVDSEAKHNKKNKGSVKRISSLSLR